MNLVTPLLDLCFPQLCVICGESLLLNRLPAPWVRLPLCSQCSERVRPIEGERCRLCSAPLISEIGTCMRCREREYPFVGNVSVFEYRGAVKELISHYKFRGQRSLALLFADRIAGVLRVRFAGLPVVPVPTRPAAIRKRGWDHVGTIATLLRRRYGMSVLPLLRRSNGASQKSLDFNHRLTNLEGRIRWARARERAAGRPVVLLDDVFTTGATASECTRVLVSHGVGAVYVLTLALD